MLKKSYFTLSVGFFSASFVILMYLFLGNVAAITGKISISEAASRWVVLPVLFVSLIAGFIFMVLHRKGKQDSSRAQAKQNRQNHYNNCSESYRPNFSNNNINRNHNHEFTDDLTKQQHQQFMDEM